MTTKFLTYSKNTFIFKLYLKFLYLHLISLQRHLLSYIDHGNGFLCLRIHDAFDLDSGCYMCTVTTIDGLQCSTFTNLNIGRNAEYTDDSGLAIMKTPLPLVVSDCGGKAMFCARVYPSDAQAQWYVCGRKIEEDENDDSYEFTVSSHFFL